jgi:hypothetical protein
MPTQVGNFAQETSTTQGTGTYSLGGVPDARFQTLVSALGKVSKDTTGPWALVAYHATDGVDHEIGLGTLTDASPDTLSRTTILESTNAGSAVNWGVGTRNMLVVNPADEIQKALAGQRVFNSYRCTSQDTPVMTVKVAAGAVRNGVAVTENVAQNSATITAPSSNPRIDRIVVAESNGVISVVAGAEAGSPSPPAVPADKIPVAQVALVVGQTRIVESDITDERVLNNIGEAFSTATAREWTARQNFNETTLADGANISWALNANQCAVVTLAGNRTLDNPTEMVAGGCYVLRVIQDGSGSQTLAYGSAYDWEGNTAPTLSTGAADVDLLLFYSDGSSMLGTYLLDVN